jgi:hypothetical protein
MLAAYITHPSSLLHEIMRAAASYLSSTAGTTCWRWRVAPAPTFASSPESTDVTALSALCAP